MRNKSDKPNFDLARIKAYELLINQENPSLGMNAEQIVMPNKKILFDTMQNYSKITGKNITNLTSNGKIKLGLNVNVEDNIYLILHNEEIYSSCCTNWTKLHEIGHICLNHQVDTDKEEVETNFFASCFAMPDAVIKYFLQCGFTVDKDFLTQYFKVSPDAAKKKVKTLNKYFPKTIYDDRIIDLLHNNIIRIMRTVDTNTSTFLEYAH